MVSLQSVPRLAMRLTAWHFGCLLARYQKGNVFSITATTLRVSTQNIYFTGHVVITMLTVMQKAEQFYRQGMHAVRQHQRQSWRPLKSFKFERLLSQVACQKVSWLVVTK